MGAQDKTKRNGGTGQNNKTNVKCTANDEAFARFIFLQKNKVLDWI
jgi:hypothetical protein